MTPDLVVQALAHLNVSSNRAEGPLAAVQERIAVAALVGSFGGLHRFLVDMCRIGPPIQESTLDLIGPSTGTGLLQLGETTIDAAVPEVLDVAERIGQEGLLRRLGIREVRLVGSRTAVEPAAHDIMRRLALLFRTRVSGTTTLVYRDHFREHGFDWDLDGAFVDSTSLPPRKAPTLWSEDTARARAFGFDVIELTRESTLAPVPWPRFVVPRNFDVRSLATQLRGGEGRTMPGLLALPRCELLVPAGRMLGEMRYRRVEVLFNWEVVRITGPELPDGAVYPVISPQRFVRSFVGMPQYDS
jgi:hypothetical protein